MTTRPSEALAPADHSNTLETLYGAGLLRGTWYGVWVSRRRANRGGDGDFSDKFEGECGEDEGAIWRLGFCASI